MRSKLTRAMAQGEAYYILNGSGANEPKGLNTSLTAAGAVYTSSNTASDSTVAGSVRAAVARMIEALAVRNVEASATVMNSGDAAHALVQGSDSAGFWVDDSGQTRLLGLPIVATTAIASKTAIVGDFRQAELYLGDDLRIDVSDQAGGRWEIDATGFRGEEELVFSADPTCCRATSSAAHG